MTGATQSLSDTFSVIAFYGINHSPCGVEAFYKLSLGWLESLGLQPDCMGFSGDGQGGPLAPFARTAKKLSRAGFESITSFELYTVEANATLFWADCIASAYYDGTTAGGVAFLTVRESLARLDHLIMTQTALQIVDSLRPVYGIGFTREKQDGPGLYVLGVTKRKAGYTPSDEEYQEKLRIGRWGDIAMPAELYRRGILRDVYVQNFLTCAHLVRQVAGIELRDWIAQDSNRGELAPISDAMSLWSVSEEQLPTIQLSLRIADMIFDWKKWI